MFKRSITSLHLGAPAFRHDHSHIIRMLKYNTTLTHVFESTISDDDLSNYSTPMMKEIVLLLLHNTCLRQMNIDGMTMTWWPDEERLINPHDLVIIKYSSSLKS